jgi:hypothetical protein
VLALRSTATSAVEATWHLLGKTSVMAGESPEAARRLEEETQLLEEVMNVAQQLVGCVHGLGVHRVGTLLRHWAHTTTVPSAPDSQHAGPVHSARPVSPQHTMSSSDHGACGLGASARDEANSASGVGRRRPSSPVGEPNAGGGQHATPGATPAAAARASPVDAHSGRMPGATHSPVFPHAAPFPAQRRASASVRPNNPAPAGPAPSAAPLRTPASASPAAAPPGDGQKRVAFVWREILQVRFPFSTLLAPFGAGKTLT